MEAREIKVIAVTKGATREYYTLEGIFIGKQRGGVPVKAKPPKPIKKKVGGV